MPNAAELAARLKGSRAGDGWIARCPAHDDTRASLSIGQGNDGRLLLKCHAGCATQAILSAIGLTFADLHDPRNNGNAGRPRIVATYDYRDEHGECLSQAVRFVPKDFKQRRPDGAGGWIWNLKNVRRVLYRLPELMASSSSSDPVFVVEGEKDADALIAAGAIATTNMGGSGKWQDEYREALRGRYVVILPDNDEPGRAHAKTIATSLSAVAAFVKVLALEGLPPKGDVSDWLAAGGTVGALKRLASEAPEWQPGALGSMMPRRGRSARELCAARPVDVHWAIPGYLAYGGITELDAPIKLGKTTLALYWVRTLITEAPCFGIQTVADRVVYVSEQPDASLAEALKRAGLGQEDRLIVLSRYDLRGLSWLDIVALAKAEAQRIGGRMIVFDTLSGLAQLVGDSENNSGVATETMAPLQDLAAEGYAILITRHDRKSGGAVGESARGSSAFGGSVDVIVGMRRPEGAHEPTRRVLESVSRFQQTPLKLVVELVSAQLNYPALSVWAETFEVLGDAEDVRFNQAKDAIRAHLTDVGVATEAEVKAALENLPRTTVQRALKDLDLEVVGAGRRGDPKRYALKKVSAQAVTDSLLFGQKPSQATSSQGHA